MTSLTRTCSPTSFIALLLACGCPAAIAGFVVTVVIDTVDAHAFGSFSHVGKEVCKVVPPLAHTDPSRTILREFVVCGIFTTTNHRLPRIVNRAVALTVLGISCDEPFSVNATAACGFATREALAENCSLVPALAATKPFGLPASGLLFASRDHRQSTKTLANERSELCLPQFPAKAPAAGRHSAYKVSGYYDTFSAALAETVPKSFFVSRSVERDNGQPAERLAREIVNGNSLLGRIGRSHVNLQKGLRMVRAGMGDSPCSARFILQHSAGGAHAC